MGKTKTAFVKEVKEDVKKSSFDELKEKRAKQEALRVPGLKGGQRIKIIEAMPAEETHFASADAKAMADKQATRGHREPKVRSKKYNEAKTKVDGNKSYSAKEALALVKQTSYSAFDGAVELHLVVKKNGLSVNVTFPHPFGREKKIEIATEKTIEKLKAGKIDFDVLIATAEIMPKLIPFAKILGPKGLMPNPKNGTLVKDIKSAKAFSSASVTVKTEKEAPLIHTVIGRVSQKDAELAENLETVIKAVSDKQIVRAYLKATMGPSVKVQF